MGWLVAMGATTKCSESCTMQEKVYCRKGHPRIKWKNCKFCESERRKLKYLTDPEYRRRRQAAAQKYHDRIKLEKQNAGTA